MNKFERLQTLFEAMCAETIEINKLSEQAQEAHVQSLLDKVKRDLEEYKATSIIPMDGFNSNKAAEEEIASNSKKAATSRTTTSSRASSIKENNSDLANHIEPKRSARITRLTTAESNKMSTVKMCDKMLIKMERITENFSNATEADTTDILKKIKKEPEEMPPPSRQPIKRTRGRKLKADNSSSIINVAMKQESLQNHTEQLSGRESDVVLQANKVLNVTIADSDEESHPMNIKPVRTRTKRRKLSKVGTSASEESENDQKTKHHELAAKPKEMNLTVVLDKKDLAANTTFVVNKQTFTNQEKQLLTDDEDVIDNSVKETRGNKKKQIFNPYVGSPVKNRVAAFEKLGGGTTDTNLCSTRAKTKKNGENTALEESPSTNSKKKGAIPKLRIDRQQNTPTATTAKYTTALKSTEFRTRELRRQQNEKEALQKKEALINAQTEEIRRRNEERKLKAQQQRDVLEKEKQQLHEAAENAKLLKIKQIQEEKEAKQLKLKEDSNKKRQLVLKKAALEKQKEDKRKLATNKDGIPLLPTADCYDSDESTNGGKRTEKPIWQNNRLLLITQKAMSYLSKEQKKLFSCGPQYPDVRLIFPGSKPVTRNSSIIWDTSVSMLHSMIQEADEE